MIYSVFLCYRAAPQRSCRPRDIIQLLRSLGL